MRLIFADRALADLDKIRDHIREESPRAAEQTLKSLIAACDMLSLFPRLGRSGFAAGTREWVSVRPYVIVYKVSDDIVEIARIWHAAQDR